MGSVGVEVHRDSSWDVSTSCVKFNVTWSWSKNGLFLLSLQFLQFSGRFKESIGVFPTA